VSRGEHARDEAAAQMAALKKLLQQPAAQLSGWTPRGLRDSDAPRNPDGSYDGAKLVKWLLEREQAKRKVVDLKAIDHELRQEKLREVRRKNDMADGLLVQTSKVGDELLAIGKRMLEGAKQIGKRFGPEAEKAVFEIFENARNAWEKSVESRRSSSRSRPPQAQEKPA
jgi:hypothetical protein